MFFVFNDTATTEIYTLSLHDALPISTALSDFTTKMSGSSADIGTLISGDNTKYSNALGYVKKFSLGNVVLGSQSDPCFGGNLIKGVVVNSNVRQKLDALPKSPAMVDFEALSATALE